MAGEWVETKLEDVSDDITVGFVGSMSSLFLDRGIPLLRGQNIQPGRLDLANLKYISPETHHKWKKSALRAGDVVIVRVGYPGTSCVIPEGMGDLNAASLVIVRPSKTKLDSRFLCYFLNSTSGQQVIRSRLVGSVQQVFNTGTAASLNVLLPPLNEQKAIAGMLGALDDKIELNRRMNTTLEAMARALFQSWFVDFDPVRAKLDGRQPFGLDKATADLFPDHLEDSAIGRVPRGWSVQRLGEIADFDKGLSYKGDGLANEGGMPMVNLGCFTGRGLFNADRVKRYTGEYRDRHLVYAGDLVIANTDMTQNRVIIGSPAIVPELHGEKEFLFTHHVFAARFKPGCEIWRRYVFFTLLKPEFREIAEGFSTGTTVLALPRDGLLNYCLCLPPTTLLDVFEKQITPLFAAVDANLHESRALATLRDTLLPKLLSGELRVPQALAA